jgi:calcineurin-like phosphoesterase family protein
MKYYIGDTHFDHANIIKYCTRPFTNVQEMNAQMLANIQAIDTPTNALIHVGDVAFGAERWLSRVPPLASRANNILVAGNHDRIRRHGKLYSSWFDLVIGSEDGWKDQFIVIQDTAFGRAYRVMLSHAPQVNMHGCDFNIHGHTHNNRHGYDNSPLHLNVSVELTDYKPVTLEQLLIEQSLPRLGQIHELRASLDDLQAAVEAGRVADLVLETSIKNRINDQLARARNVLRGPTRPEEFLVDQL